MSLANQLTLIRLVAVVPVMVALYLPFEWARPVAVVLYVAAILTDYFDGIIARRNNEVTGFGKLMDSIADKALIVSLFFALVGEGSMAGVDGRDHGDPGVRRYGAQDGRPRGRGGHRRQPLGQGEDERPEPRRLHTPTRASQGLPAGRASSPRSGGG